MKPVTDMIVLGSAINSPPDAWRTLSHRMRAAWKSWAGIRNQIRTQRICLLLRIQLLEGVVLPSLLWGLDTLCLTRPQRDNLTTIQRVMVGRMLKLFQKPRETRWNFSGDHIAEQSGGSPNRSGGLRLLVMCSEQTTVTASRESRLGAILAGGAPTVIASLRSEEDKGGAGQPINIFVAAKQWRFKRPCVDYVTAPVGRVLPPR